MILRLHRYIPQIRYLYFPPMADALSESCFLPAASVCDKSIESTDARRNQFLYILKKSCMWVSSTVIGAL